uniref:tRNA pseudouridine(55) synthase n=1 Tax=Rhabditophanes sp. KR3021 TaxID=114890 RepID=A0AC35UGU9_9BILA
MGLFDDQLLIKVAEDTNSRLKGEGFDTSTFIFALNLPTSFHLREYILRKVYFKDGESFGKKAFKNEASDYFMSQINASFGYKPTLSSDFTVTINLDNKEYETQDNDFLLFAFPNEYSSYGSSRKRKTEPVPNEGFNKNKVSNFGNRLTVEQCRSFKMASPTTKLEATVQLEREAIYLAGRYCKFSRCLPQSPWSVDIDTPSIPGNSVSEKIGNILKDFTKADSHKFLASGREDIDVRMLGEGRPFAVELKNARLVKGISCHEWGKCDMESNCRSLQDQINKASTDIKINSLVRVTTKDIDNLIEGQEDKQKSYTAYCYSKVPLDGELLKELATKAPIQLIQKTPVRVLKRRCLMDRPRMINSMSALQMDPFHFYIRMSTQAGTYVKEFVHGDFGRTRPCLSELLGLETGTVDILQLDVEEVDLPWPPKKLG